MNLELKLKKNFPIHEFDLWIESMPVQVTPDTSKLRVEVLITELQWARRLLDENNTGNNRRQLEEVVKEAEEEASELSPVFRKRTWNLATGRHE